MHRKTILKFKQKYHSDSVLTQSKRVQSAIFLVVSLVSFAAPAQAPAKGPSLPYFVRPSDNLSKFGREILTSKGAWNEVAISNQLNDPDVIFPGQKPDIPLRFLKSKPASGKVISTEGDVTLRGGAMQQGAALADDAKIKTGANRPKSNPFFRPDRCIQS